jgi:hypothetical protein
MNGDVVSTNDTVVLIDYDVSLVDGAVLVIGSGAVVVSDNLYSINF